MTNYWGCISKTGRDRGKQGGTEEQPLSNKPPLMQFEEAYSTWQ